MEKQESPKTRPQREADRRKRQTEALKANLKRRKVAAPADNGEESDDSAS
jgi:hypothetical protein